MINESQIAKDTENKRLRDVFGGVIFSGGISSALKNAEVGAVTLDKAQSRISLEITLPKSAVDEYGNLDSNVTALEQEIGVAFPYLNGVKVKLSFGAGVLPLRENIDTYRKIVLSEVEKNSMICAAILKNSQ